MEMLLNSRTAQVHDASRFRFVLPNNFIRSVAFKAIFVTETILSKLEHSYHTILISLLLLLLNFGLVYLSPVALS